MPNQIRISEIFYSLQGEANTVGQPTVFVRLTGCPLRCRYCDTSYAFTGGKLLTVSQIIAEVKTYQTALVTVTGGEPLAQPDCFAMLEKLCDEGFEVSLETSGAVNVEKVDRRVVKVMDLKTPGSGEEQRNIYANLTHLTSRDQVKFVICDRDDYEWSKAMSNEHALPHKVSDVLFSASYDQLSSRQLAEWILQDRLQVRLQIQLHKYLWGEIPGV